ncbi:NADAR family protein [Winogradskya consettensis]|uniref:NADAR family protein n=1 Tax=Winogradskya consettensis TaxID=113560 RepID=UPI001BB3281C|nr:NADAR family protein [Actinoplanes consettensis]
MALGKRTYRVVDGERIEGTWRHVFIRNGGTYFLSDLLVFADGAISCWEWVDLDGLREKLASGWVATSLEAGAEASAHHLAGWRFEEPQMYVDAEELLGEVADEIDELNGRPDSTQRCTMALDTYLASRAEADREALRVAYLGMPAHIRRYALGDMDAKDGPLRVLCTPVGERTTWDEVVTEQMRDQAFEYFADRDRSVRKWRENRPLDGPEQAQSPTVMLASTLVNFPASPGIQGLRNECPVTITIGDKVYASAVHAYWSLATTDEPARAAIAAAGTAFQAEQAAGKAPIRPDWPKLRAAAMHTVLLAKFTQNPAFAEILLSTGDARIDYNSGSAYWSGGANGRNWLGRLLELVRSEVVAHRADFL